MSSATRCGRGWCAAPRTILVERGRALRAARRCGSDEDPGVDEAAQVDRQLVEVAGGGRGIGRNSWRCCASTLKEAVEYTVNIPPATPGRPDGPHR
jgi:hypothetical protein